MFCLCESEKLVKERGGGLCVREGEDCVLSVRKRETGMHVCADCDRDLRETMIS